MSPPDVRTRGYDVDTASRNELLDICGQKPQVAANPEERDPPLGDQTPHEAHRRPEPISDLLRGQQLIHVIGVLSSA
jgi:hypothetical protein